MLSTAEVRAENSEPPPPATASTGHLPSRWFGAIAVLVTVLRFGPEWVTAYQPGNDESWLLQSGVRLTEGRGLTCYMHDNWADLSRPLVLYVSYWPPMPALVFAALIALTGGVPTAVAGLKLLNATACLLGTLGWLRLADRVLAQPWAVGFFALCLAGLFFPDGQDAGVMHLYFWAAMPWILSHVLCACQSGRTWPLVWAGLLTALSVVYRFHAGYLLPGLGLAVLLLDRSPMGRRVLQAAVPVGLGTLAILGVMGFYRSQGVAASWLDAGPPEFGPRNSWENLLYREGLTYWFSFGFGLEEAVYRLRPSARSGLPFAVWLPWYGLLVALAIWAARRTNWSPDRRQFAVLTGVLSAALVGLLAATSYRGMPAPEWMPLQAVRLYSELLPAVGLVWVLLFAELTASVSAAAGERGRLPVHTPGGVLLWAVVVGLVVLAVRPVIRVIKTDVHRVALAFRYGLGADTPHADAVRRLLSARPADTVPVVLDAHYDVVASMRIEGVLRSERYPPPPETWDHIASSQPVYVIVVVRRSGGAYDLSEWGRRYATFFGLRPLGEVAGAPGVELYSGVVPAFEPGRRPAPH